MKKPKIEELIVDKSNIGKLPFYVNKISGYITARCSGIFLKKQNIRTHLMNTF